MGTIAHQLATAICLPNLKKIKCSFNMIILLKNLLKELGIPYGREKRKVKKAFRHIGHSHE